MTIVSDFPMDKNSPNAAVLSVLETWRRRRQVTSHTSIKQIAISLRRRKKTELPSLVAVPLRFYGFNLVGQVKFCFTISVGFLSVNCTRMWPLFLIIWEETWDLRSKAAIWH